MNKLNDTDIKYTFDKFDLEKTGKINYRNFN
jgi:hypothetical protein